MDLSSIHHQFSPRLDRAQRGLIRRADAHSQALQPQTPTVRTTPVPYLDLIVASICDEYSVGPSIRPDVVLQRLI